MVLKDNMQRADLMRGKRLKEYIRDHVESWYPLVELLDLSDELGQ